VQVEIQDGVLALRDQLKDYAFRGDGLELYNFLDYNLDTYEGEPVRERNDGESHTRRGPATHDRFPYKHGAGKGGRCRIMRGKGHETMPDFVGRWFPRNNRDDERDLYCASMLLLLKPWRCLETNLLLEGHTWSQSFDTFMSTASQKAKNIVANIQYFHECSDGAKNRPNQTYDGGLLTVRQQAVEVMEQQLENPTPRPLSEWDVEHARESRISRELQAFGSDAMAIAHATGIFNAEHQSTVYCENPRKAAMDDMELFMDWSRQLTSIVEDESVPIGNGIAGETILPSLPQTAPPVAEAKVTQIPGTRGVPAFAGAHKVGRGGGAGSLLYK